MHIFLLFSCCSHELKAIIKQKKKGFTSTVLLDIIPHRALYVLKFAVIWFLSMVPMSVDYE